MALQTTKVATRLHPGSPTVDTEIDALTLIFRLQIQRSYADVDPGVLERAKGLANQTKDTMRKARLYHAMGQMAVLQRDFKMATKFTGDAYRIWKLQDEKAEQVDCLLTFALIARWQLKVKRASKLVTYAQSQIKETSAHRQHASLAYELGNVKLWEDDYETAEKLYQTAVTHFQRLQMPDHLARSLQSLALALIGKKEYRTAAKHLRAARKTYTRYENAYGRADVRLAEGYLELERGRLARAFVFFYHAYRLSHEIQDRQVRGTMIEQIDIQARRGFDQIGW